jgi:hypothetical protein
VSLLLWKVDNCALVEEQEGLNFYEAKNRDGLLYTINPLGKTTKQQSNEKTSNSVFCIIV